MRRLRDGLVSMYAVVGDRAIMHVAPLVGAAVALAVNVLFSGNAELQIAIVAGLTVVGREIVEWSGHAARRLCRTSIAAFVVALLDDPLDLTRFDRVHAGDYLTLRRVANRARGGGLSSVVVPGGGPADTFAGTLERLAKDLEIEVGRCYGKIGRRDKARIDALADTLRATAGYARALANPSPDLAAQSVLIASLGDALVATVVAGEALTRSFDRHAHDADVAARARAAATRQATAWDAAEVLLANARAVEAALYEGGSPSELADAATLAAQIRTARDVGLHVDASAYRTATDEVRDAHHRIVYDDLFAALELVEGIRHGAHGTEDPIEAAQALLARVSGDVKELERHIAALPGLRWDDVQRISARAR